MQTEKYAYYPADSQLNKKKLVVFVALAYGISWLIWMPQCLSSNFHLGWSVSKWNHLFGGLGPILSALITTLIFEKKKGVKNYFRTRFLRLPNWKWLIIGAGMPVFFFIIPMIFLGLVNGEWVKFSDIGLNSKVPVTNSLLIWLIWCFFYGVGEEGGWRGFLFPELTKKYKARIATLFTAFVWAPWHLPVFFYDKDLSNLGIFGFIGWITGLIFGSLLLGWLVKQSRWNLMPVILWHGTFNFFTTSDRISAVFPTAMIAMVIALVLWIARRYGPDLVMHKRAVDKTRGL
jgi:membrane protease YdiL (CAAX protease family)